MEDYCEPTILPELEVVEQGENLGGCGGGGGEGTPLLSTSAAEALELEAGLDHAVRNLQEVRWDEVPSARLAGYTWTG